MNGLLVALSLVSGAIAPQQPGSAPLEPWLESRVQRLGKELRCAVCQGLSIADSPASMARAQLDKLRELVSAGKTDEEIRAYFVERYGEWVLLSPRAAGFNWLVWLGPAALIVAGFAIIIYQIRKHPLKGQPATSRRDGAPGAVAKSELKGQPPADEYLLQVRSELER
jgi:cytochrome c-type biogenesis protein CcmH